MKKLLLIGMLTAAGALNLHAASSNNQSAQMNSILEKYGDHAEFIKMSLQHDWTMGTLKISPEQRAQKQLDKKAQQDKKVFYSMVNNPKIIDAMIEFYDFFSTMPINTRKDDVESKKHFQKLKETMNNFIGEQEHEMRGIIQNYFQSKYIKNILKVSDDDIQAVQDLKEEAHKAFQALQKERNDALSQLNSQPRQLQVEH